MAKNLIYSKITNLHLFHIKFLSEFYDAKHNYLC
jgi:hypothetical protein